MKVWGLTETEIRDAVAECQLAVHGDWADNGVFKDGRALRFRLAVDRTQLRDEHGMLPYQRLSQRGDRKLAAACWHGHREVMRALFRRNPEARIQTALADYRGAEDFEARHESTYGSGNGWHVAYGQACGCRSVRTVTLQQSTIRACPFVIFVPEHYRDDGSCRCDSQSHRAMMKRDWGYSDEDFVGIPVRSAA